MKNEIPVIEVSGTHRRGGAANWGTLPATNSGDACQPAGGVARWGQLG